MPLLIGLGVGAAAGGLKYGLIDEPAYQRKKQLAAETQRFSPWTGMQAQAPDEPNAFGEVLQYGTTGAMMGQGVGNAQAQQAMNGQMGDWMGAQTDYYNNMNPGMAQNAPPNSMSLAPSNLGMNPWAVQQPKLPPGYGYPTY